MATRFDFISFSSRPYLVLGQYFFYTRGVLVEIVNIIMHTFSFIHIVEPSKLYWNAVGILGNTVCYSYIRNVKNAEVKDIATRVYT